MQGTYGAATRLTRQLGELQQTFLARAGHVHELTLAAYQEGGATLLQVLDATRCGLKERLALRSDELDSMMASAQSRLDVSVERFFATHDHDPKSGRGGPA